MGHVHLQTLPRKPAWNHVRDAISAGESVDAIVVRTVHAASEGLDAACQDLGLTFSFSLLARFALAAGEEDFPTSLSRIGIVVDPEVDGFGVAAAFCAAVDRVLQRPSTRTDIGEMAQLAAVESLVGFLVVPGFSLSEVAKRVADAPGFARLTQSFFARFAHRFLGYHLDRELPLHVGPARRFARIDDHLAFLDELRRVCDRAASTVRDRATRWFEQAGDASPVPTDSPRFAVECLRAVRQRLAEPEIIW